MTGHDTDTLDPRLRDALHGQTFHTGSLDPEQILTAAKRRHRRTKASGAAVIGVTACAVAGSFVATTAHAPRQDLPAAGPPAAVTTPAALPVLAAGWARLSPRGVVWTDRNGYFVNEAVIPHPSQAVYRIDSDDRASGATPLITSSRGSLMSSAMLLRDDGRRVVFVLSGSRGTFRHEARRYRLAALPGWVLAYSEYTSPSSTTVPGQAISFRLGIEVYDARGARLTSCEPEPSDSEKAGMRSKGREWKPAPGC